MIIVLNMEICVEYNSLIKEIQERFSDFYPYLKIEFYSKPFIKQSHASKKDVVEMNGKSILSNQFNCKGSINISGSRTVRELESDIASMGLFGQVLRKSGHMWIETVLTNDWTLQHQNYEGEQISSLYDKTVMPPSR